MSRSDDGQRDGLDRAGASDWHHADHDDSDMPYEAEQGQSASFSDDSLSGESKAKREGHAFTQ